MASQWFYRIGDEPMGPVTFQDLVRLVREGALTEDHRVRRDMSDQWIAAREVIGLFQAAARQEAAPSTGAASQPAARPGPQGTASPARAARPPAPPSAPPSPAPLSRKTGRAVPLLLTAVAMVILVVVGKSTYQRLAGTRAGKLATPPQAKVAARPVSSEEELAKRVEEVSAGKTKSLHLSPSPFQGDDKLAKLSELTALEELSLDKSIFTDAGLKHLEKMTSLRWLSLSETPITDEGLKTLAKLPKLEFLRLDQDRITDKGLENLKGMQSLRDLSLWRTGVTDAGLVHLATLPNVNRISLDETQVSDTGLEHLKGMQRLRILQLENTKVTPAGRKKLQQALPKLKITP